MRRLMTLGVLAMAVTACGGGAAPPPSSASADRDESSAPPSESPAASTAGGATAGAPFAGSLVDAMPKVVNGAPITVTGPMNAADLGEDLSEDMVALFDELAVPRTDIEVVFASDEAQNVLIFGMQFSGVDDDRIDEAFLGVQQAAANTGKFRVESIAGRNVHAFSAIIDNYAWVNGDKLFWVFGTEDAPRQAVAAMPPSTIALTPTGSAELPSDSMADLTLTVDGGVDAGSYTATAPDGGCSRDALGENGFGLQYSVTDASVAFSSMQVVVEDAATAGNGGTDAFFTTITLNGTEYEINPGDGGGTGSVTLADSGDDATFSVNGTTADGVTIEAEVTCHMVFDFG